MSGRFFSIAAGLLLLAALLAGPALPALAQLGTPNSDSPQGDLTDPNSAYFRYTITTEITPTEPVTLGPTSVRLVNFSASSGEITRPWAGTVIAVAFLAGIALVGLAIGLSLQRT